jgi:SpoVK/Ycf46/Vps4 family AAA+-type ATPase
MNNDNNLGNKRPRNWNTSPPTKRLHYDSDDENDIFYSYLYDDIQVVKELVIIKPNIKTLDDLINLGKEYDNTKDYNIDMYLLNKLVGPLEELNNMIGMKKVKKDMIDNIIYYIQKLDDKNKDMLHTVIEGPPGVGKTELAKIIGKIYLAMGFLKRSLFKKVSRSDMVAKYLGQTAIKTQELIDNCKGGVMFIDEVYSLGNNEKGDSFSKEAIDTLTHNLTDLKNEFICIVAGYPREIDECFFSYNPGLNSRFPIRLQIDPYTPKELHLIFKKIVKDNLWTIDDKINTEFFKKNYLEFKSFGRDMEQLFTQCKRAHSRRIFAEENPNRKCITLDDLENGYEHFLINRP